jgi:hypothetical protein
MFQRCVRQVEVYPLHQQIGTHHGLHTAVVNHRRIVANAEDGGRLAGFVVLGQMINQTKFAQG